MRSDNTNADRALLEIDALGKALQFVNLNEFKPPFSLFRLLALERKELVHSRVLAWLLDTKLGLGKVFIPEFAKEIQDVAPFAANLRGTSQVYREWKNIDVLGEWPEEKCVLAIENKIDAGEQPAQVSRYQRILEQRFPGYSGRIFYLTIDGSESQTFDSQSRFSYVPLSYRSIMNAVARVLRLLPAEHEAKPFLQDFHDHLESDFMNEGPMKERVRRLYREHGLALSLLEQYRPAFGEAKEPLSRSIRSAFPTAEIADLSVRNELRELQVYLPQWRDKGLQFCILINHYPPTRPSVRFWLYDDFYKQARDHYEAFAAFANGDSNGPVSICETYDPVPGWGVWRQVLAGEPRHEEGYVSDLSFGPSFVQQVMDRVLKGYSELNVYVERFATQG